MNTKQRIFIKMGLLIIFLIFIHTTLRIIILDINWFLMCIILLGILFMNFYFDFIIISPITEEIGYLNGISHILKKIKTKETDEFILDSTINNLTKKKK